MMTCKHTLDLLQDYLDGDLNEQQSILIEEHLADCPLCQDEYQSLVRLGDLYREETIVLPTDIQWQKSWKVIESRLKMPQYSLLHNLMVEIDMLFMGIFSPRHTGTRVAYSLGLFVIGLFMGSLVMSPTPRVYQKVVKVEHRVREVPVIQREEVVKYLNKEVAKLQVMEKIVEKPKVIYVANSNTFEPAPVFPSKEENNTATLMPASAPTDAWSAKYNVDKQIENIKNELAPTFRDAVTWSSRNVSDTN